jgi:8-amino-7-oxononanoate synthase
VEVFPHGNLAAAEGALRRHAHRPSRLICVDGVYSMSGGMPDLLGLRALALRYNATVYVDDAHGFGVLGEDPSASAPYGHRGNGVARRAGVDLARDPILYVGGLSKALKVSAHHFSAQAKEKILAAGGTVTEIPGPAPVVRNIGKASRKKPVGG